VKNYLGGFLGEFPLGILEKLSRRVDIANKWETALKLLLLLSQSLC